MRTGRARAVAATALIALATINGGAAARADVSATAERTVPAGSEAASAPVEHNHSAAQVVQFNMWGGQGNAFDNYNATVAPAVETSIMARNPYPFVISFNEICESHYNHIAWVLNANGYGYTGSNPWGYSYSQMMSLGLFFGSRIGNDDLHPNCGGWYGNALLMRGNFVSGTAEWYEASHQAPTASGELRNWICKAVTGGGSAACSTHLAAGASSYTFQQATDYRNLTGFLSGNGMYALGDLNYRPNVSPGDTAHAAWAFAGFAEADGCCAERSTTDNGYHLDYIWRRNNGGFPHQAYIGGSSHSDHHWYQGYM